MTTVEIPAMPEVAAEIRHPPPTWLSETPAKATVEEINTLRRQLTEAEQSHVELVRDGGKEAQRADLELAAKAIRAGGDDPGTASVALYRDRVATSARRIQVIGLALQQAKGELAGIVRSEKFTRWLDQKADELDATKSTALDALAGLEETLTALDALTGLNGWSHTKDVHHARSRRIDFGNLTTEVFAAEGDMNIPAVVFRTRDLIGLVTETIEATSSEHLRPAEPPP